MSQQRYVSEELTHFVGGGLSDEERQYSALLDKILRTGWLLIDPSYPVSEAQEMLASTATTWGTEPTAPSEDMYQPVVCFCDIPVTDLEIHMRKYSRFGLSFLKPFLVEKGANPVLYIANNSKSLSIGPFDKEQLVGRHALYRAHFWQFIDVMRLLRHSNDSSLSLAARSPEPPPEMSEKEWPWQRQLWPKVHSLDMLLNIYVFSHIKFFDEATADEDPANVYMERECRVLGHVNFALSDVRRVFLPEEFAERFRADLPEYTGQLTFFDRAV
jgi:Putative abortive phage resistance protein AbiGi, antitoxin